MDNDAARCDRRSVDDEESQCPAYHSMNRDCCAPHTFTSVLLGILACVLVTGGVFLAFHKWDYTWLLVSAVGVLLMAIGTVLHCCSSDTDTVRKHHRCGKGSCGVARSKPEALNNGSGAMLSEQLLPLSNARSVSQLSLNMVPGYFPPLVYPAPGSPYGLEQHSTVVQNISKLVQHQQQLHLQSPASNQSDSKSFILFPLPVDTNATNLQNIVAAVCQLDSCVHESNNETPAVDTPPASSVPSVPRETNSTSTADTVPPVLKHVEVQTCSDWNNHHQSKTLTTDASTDTTSALSLGPITSLDTNHQDHQRTENAGVQETCPTTDAFVQSDPPERNDVEELVETVPPDQQLVNLSDTICDNDIPTSLQSDDDPMSLLSVESYGARLEDEGADHSSIDNSSQQGDYALIFVEGVSELVAMCAIEEETSTVEPLDVEEEEQDNLGDVSSDFESELLDRSSPPPSYDDVTQEGAPLTFGTAYGTM